MSNPENNMFSIEDFIRYSLNEDIGDGDHTSLATIEENKISVAKVKIKEDGILSGLELAKRILNYSDKTLVFESEFHDGARIKNGDIVLTITGNTRGLLSSERLLLNCMQRMSGIATLTKKFVDAIDGSGATILDTRKTTPNFRRFEKQAVRDGGGKNHRFGLYDMILIKDNHVDASGGISNALKSTKDYLIKTNKNLSVEIETRNLKEVSEVISSGIANRIMLDNFDPEGLKEAIILIDNKFESEASGNINLSNVKSYALTGVNFISIGALTHSYKSLDISMKLM